ncbi:MAG TPA: MbnP family protein [Polyangiaceae bacterium]|jgi:hypothetical protein
MKLHLVVLWVGTAALLGGVGCSSDTQSGGSAGGAGGMAGMSNLAGEAGSSGLSQSACPENPSPLRSEGTLVSLPLRPLLANEPFVFGQPNALSDGGSLVPLNFRFYISDVQLLRADDEPLAVDVVSAAGAPEPYGVHLFNAEDADTSTLRLLAPAGEYSGFRFSLGLKLSCNQQHPASLSDPLTDTSQMTWPHTGGFLFLRYEALYTPAENASASPEIPPAVHMGGNIMQELVPRVTVQGALSVPESGTLERGVVVVMDEIFKGATANLDVSDVTVGFLNTPETEAGERLRRELPTLNAFLLEP